MIYIIKLEELKINSTPHYFSDMQDDSVIEVDEPEKAKVYFSKGIAIGIASFLRDEYDLHVTVLKCEFNVVGEV